MALGDKIASGDHNTSAATWDLTVTQAVPVGTLVVVQVGYDNATSTQPTVSTVTDSKGNAYALVGAAFRHGGSAGAGVHSAMFSSVLTTALAAADTITVTLSSAVVAKVGHAIDCTGYEDTVVVGPTVGAGGSASPALSQTGVLDGGLVVAFWAHESNEVLSSDDTDTTNGTWSPSVRTVLDTGTSATSVQVVSQIKEATADGTQQFQPTWAASSDAAGVIVEFATAAPPPPPPPPPTSAGLVDKFFVHVDDFGAVPDSVWDSAAGTDSTPAINAAIAATASGGAHQGKSVLIGPGNYKTTGPIVMLQGTSLVAQTYTRSAAVGNDETEFATRIDFHGGSTDNCIQAIGTTETSMSRVTVQGLKIVDRRTAPTSGHGILFQKVVNQSIIRGCDIHGFPGGSSVYVVGGVNAGERSDCITLEDLWVGMGSQPGRPQYGIYCGGVDNSVRMSEIRIDTPLGSTGVLAGIRVEYAEAAITISNVKHENKGGIPTIIVGTQAFNVVCNGIEARTGDATNMGPLIQFAGENTGVGTVALGLRRSFTGSLVKRGGSLPYDITGQYLPIWTGLGHTARSFYISGSTLIHGGGAQIAGSGQTLGFYGAAGVAKPTVSGDTAAATATVLSDLIAALAAQGLLTDSTT